MIPYTIVLEPALVVYKIYNRYLFFGRPTMEDLRQDLRAVTSKCRPDWDITTPELKAAWEQGHKERFYPYGKTYAQTIGEILKLAALARGGNSLKVSSHWRTNTCAGTKAKNRSASHLS